MTTQDYLTSTEAAKLIGCASITIRKNVERERIRPIRKAGNTYIFTRQEVLRFKRHFQPKK